MQAVDDEVAHSAHVVPPLDLVTPLQMPVPRSAVYPGTRRRNRRHAEGAEYASVHGHGPRGVSHLA